MARTTMLALVVGSLLLTLTARTAMAKKIEGTEGCDILDGTRGADVIRGEGGPDDIEAFGGPDRAYGDGGDDDLYGGRGDDVYRGDDGDDDFNEGHYESNPFADRGRDEYHGEAGDDAFYARPDGVRDRIFFGGGADLVGAAAEDFVAGDCEEVTRY